MKFKNYRNPHTKDNRIYSYRDLYDMPFGEFIKRKQEVISQYRVLGVPTEKELKGSDNVVYVEAYTREDGTEVKAHYRSKPNGGGGVNSPISVVSEVNDTNDVKEQKENSFDVIKTENRQNEAQEQTELAIEQKERQKDKRLYPDEVAGVKRGEPKTFEQMMQQGVNPKYMSEEDEKGDYSSNCQSCTVAAELVIRGYDVEAGPYSIPEAKELAKVDKSAYLDPETGEECVPEKIDVSNLDCYDYLDKTIKSGERYEFSYHITPENGKWADTESHVVMIYKTHDNQLAVYDPQNGDRADGNKQSKLYVDSVINEYNTEFEPRILRVDDKVLNPKYTNKVVRKR